MSLAQADRLRALVRTVFAEHGREVTVYADHVEDDQGTQFGLWNLAALCHGEVEREWRELVQRHVGALIAPKPTVEDLSDDELRSMVRARLLERGALPRPEWHPHAVELAGQLVEILCVDLPDSVLTPAEVEFSRRGGALGPWLDAGRANLRAELAATELEHEHEQVTPGGGLGGFEVLMADSVYTASFALFLPEMLARAGRADQGRGVLVTLPSRSQVAFRVVDGDGPDHAMAVQHLFRFAMAGYDDAPGGVSPHVYWVHAGSWRQVTGFDEQGRPAIHVDEELGRALGLLDED